MVSISQNAEGVKNSSSQTYDTAGIRHLPIEEQVRYRKDKVDTWLRLRADGYTAEGAAEKVGVSSLSGIKMLLDSNVWEDHLN